MSFEKCNSLGSEKVILTEEKKVEIRNLVAEFKKDKSSDNALEIVQTLLDNGESDPSQDVLGECGMTEGDWVEIKFKSLKNTFSEEEEEEDEEF